MLTEMYVNAELGEKLLSREQFKPFATFSDRNAWKALPEELRSQFIQVGESYLNFDYPILPAIRYMDFDRDGDRSRYEELYFHRREVVGSLAIAECLDGQGRFIDDLMNGLWALCEESSWVVPAHNQQHRNQEPLPDVSCPDIDLFAGETGALLCWIWYLLHEPLDAISPTISQRIQHEVRQRILDPYLKRDDMRWMGFVLPGPHVNNWNPWCNFNCLTAFFLLDENHERRVQAASKALKSLDIFLDRYHDDGGCDEGPFYWNHAGGKLFDHLELLRLATQGYLDVYDDPLIQNIGRYLYHMHIDDRYFVNFADGNVKLDIPAELVYRYGQRIGDEQLSSLGLAAFHKDAENLPFPELFPCQYPMFRVLSYLWNYETMRQKTADPPYIRDVWMEGLQVMTARERHGSAQGLFLAAKGGHNDESHSHNDVGHFIVYADGEPVLIDVGVEEYIRETFNAERYKIWTMQSPYHNLPTVRKIQQSPGENFKASDVHYQCEDDLVEFSLNLVDAYPPEAGIERWIRTCRLARDGQASVEICDNFTLRSATDDIMLSLMTSCEHDIETPGLVSFRTISGRRIRMEYDAAALEISSERLAIDDSRLVQMWGDHLFRLVFRAKQTTQQAQWSMTVTALKSELR